MWRSRTRKHFFGLVTFFVTSFPKNVTFWHRRYKKILNGKKLIILLRPDFTPNKHYENSLVDNNCDLNVLTSHHVPFTPGNSRLFSFGLRSILTSHGLMLVRDSLSRCTSDWPLTITCYILTLTSQPIHPSDGTSFQVFTDAQGWEVWNTWTHILFRWRKTITNQLLKTLPKQHITHK